MKQSLLLILTYCLITFDAISQGHIVSPTDFEVILGEPWQGTLSYQDYQSDKEVMINANLEIEKISEGEYRFNYIYPEEPKANSKAKIKLGKNHMSVNKNTIISRERLNDGTLIFETKEVGKDNKKKAVLYYTYELSTTRLTITKKVKYDGETEAIIRNKYAFQR